MTQTHTHRQKKAIRLFTFGLQVNLEPYKIAEKVSALHTLRAQVTLRKDRERPRKTARRERAASSHELQ